uniref:Phytocyanin domain-containing protein n=1 Tax=Leersia perrieri TaxID=77586 RepID=A0A0D9XD41_9ORYZ
MAALLLVVLVVAAAASPASAKDYTVGESSGWRTGVDYTAWANGKAFVVGDTLLFQHNGVHSVEEVSAADHGSCSASNPLRSYKDGTAVVALTRAGIHYFICGTTGHCAAGMKLAVTVTTAGTTKTNTSAGTA